MSSVSSTSVRPSGRVAENVREQLVAPVQQTRQHGDHFTTVSGDVDPHHFTRHGIGRGNRLAGLVIAKEQGKARRERSDQLCVVTRPRDRRLQVLLVGLEHRAVVHRQADAKAPGVGRARRAVHVGADVVDGDRRPVGADTGHRQRHPHAQRHAVVPVAGVDQQRVRHALELLLAVVSRQHDLHLERGHRGRRRALLRARGNRRCHDQRLPPIARGFESRSLLHLSTMGADEGRRRRRPARCGAVRSSARRRRRRGLAAGQVHQHRHHFGPPRPQRRKQTADGLALVVPARASPVPVRRAPGSGAGLRRTRVLRFVSTARTVRRPLAGTFGGGMPEPSTGRLRGASRAGNRSTGMRLTTTAETSKASAATVAGIHHERRRPSTGGLLHVRANAGGEIWRRRRRRQILERDVDRGHHPIFGIEHRLTVGTDRQMRRGIRAQRAPSARALIASVNR